MWKLQNWSLATNAHKLMQNIRTDVSCRECTLFLMCQSEQIQPAKIFHYINLHLAPHLEHDLSVETQERWNSWMLVSCFHPKHDSFTLPPCLHFLYLRLNHCNVVIVTWHLLLPNFIIIIMSPSFQGQKKTILAWSKEFHGHHEIKIKIPKWSIT